MMDFIKSLLYPALYFSDSEFGSNVSSGFATVHTWVSAIGCALIHFVWQGGIIASTTAFLLMIFRNARPQIRYSISCFALILCVILPTAMVIDRLHSSGAAVQNVSLSNAHLDLMPDTLSTQRFASYLQSNLLWIVLCWLVSVIILSFRMGMGLFWISRYTDTKRNLLCNQANAHLQTRLTTLANQFGVRRDIGLRVVDDLKSPITVGCWRPLILVPASLMTGMPAPLLEALLAHELAHISRFDYAVNLIQSLIEMLLFYHPAVWWISKQIRIEREQIADDLAARILGEPRRLALALQELDLFQFSTPQLAQAAHGGHLMSRIKRLLRPEVQPINWKAAMSVVTLSAVCLSVYAHSASQANPQADPNTSGVVKSNAAKQASSASTHKITDPIIDFNKCHPEYPSDSLAKGEEGSVYMSVLIDRDGTIKQTKLDKTSGFPALDEAVSKKLLACTMKATPGKVDGKSRLAWVKVQYVWRLD
ncbi:M56 family metallopeptidase [Undibacterium sp. 5I1]|uniref:M56 family metallopeptidase n=1 Tax=unclassified Undibacterium TaxID=2630295 RepID=UPI002AB5DB51|nr:MULTISPECIES: M56 family metallopeptidase [unclassified Undibacterium]MDY7537811.1 M56 family metallopeptidase [Undibacterium sp. 5I1]MEB0229928.1 M56 family metallopeptidase [Undibacterium sp. 10I3]MEB0257607.1 M56 family metallopeptidase [Undibacterium sp. 5I1]